MATYARNIGELKKLIADLPDDTPLVSTESNYEMRGSITQASASISYFKPETQHFVDDFDGTPYSAKVFVDADEKEGQLMLKF